MPVEDDILEFQKWANRLGCPKSIIHNEKWLKMMFRSKQSQNLHELMKIVLPKNVVQHIRDNIVVSKISKVDGEFGTLAVSTLPKVLQRYKKVENLQNKLKNTYIRINTVKTEIDHIINSISTENKKKTVNEIKLNSLITRNNILELKLLTFTKELNMSKETKQNLIDVKNYNNENLKGDGIKRQKYIITNLIESFVQNENIDDDKFFINKLETDLYSIPNNNKWKIITELTNESSNLIKFYADKVKIKNEQKDKYFVEVLLAKGYAEHVKFHLNLRNLKTKMKEFKKYYDEQFQQFYNSYEVNFKLNYSNNFDNSDDLESFLESYLEIFITKFLFEGQISFLKTKLETCKNDINEFNKVFETNTETTKDFNNIYLNIHEMVEKIQGNCLKISNVKVKLNQKKNTMSFMMNDILYKRSKLKKNVCNFNTTNMDSFGDNDSVLCSTKIGGDLDNTNRSENTIIPGNQQSTNSTQLQLTEFQLFIDIPVYKFKKYSFNLSLDLQLNPIVLHKNKISDELFGFLFDNHILTGAGILQEIENSFESNDLLQTVTTNVMDYEVENFIEVDKEQIKIKSSQQKQCIAEILDEIAAITTYTKPMLTKNKKYYEKIIENPFKKYIPSKITFNGLSYKAYENEYLVYYRMHKNAN